MNGTAGQAGGDFRFPGVLFKIDGVGAFTPVVLSVQNRTDIDIEADLLRYGNPLFNWQDGQDPTNWEYRISIITSRGNFFDTVARPFNT